MRALLPLLLVSLMTGPAASTESLSLQRQRELANLVLQDCGSCHGLTMKGGLGKPLLPQVLAPFPEASLAEVILDGVSGTPMPPWRGMITEAEALWIARALKQGIAQ